MNVIFAKSMMEYVDAQDDIGWVLNTGVLPVNNEDIVDIMLVDKQVLLAEMAGAWDWKITSDEHDFNEHDILKWRLVKRAEIYRPKQPT